MRIWLILAAAGALVALETLRPLRSPRRESRRRHTARNLAIAGLAAATVQAFEQPVVMPVSASVARRRWGLVPRLRLPRPVEVAVMLAAMDYTLYLWHVLAHRVPALWRFHAVHHVDLDLDASTAVRFHLGELLVSVPWRVAQVMVIGVDPRTLLLWQRLTLVSILFHHSNARLPRWVERALGSVLVTPRMHGIHHSVEETERDSNWSSGLSIWDRLHGTLRTDVRQRDIVIGVGGFQRPEDVTLGAVLAQPFNAGTRRPELPSTD